LRSRKSSSLVLRLTEELIGLSSKEGEAKAKAALFEALNSQGRQYEAMALSSTLGDFWKDRKKDLSVIPELVRRLEAKMLPVPGTKILLSKTEFTVGEWKLAAAASTGILSSAATSSASEWPSVQFPRAQARITFGWVPPG
jgi:hypothetical protein